jgi:hypothetical protein
VDDRGLAGPSHDHEGRGSWASTSSTVMVSAAVMAPLARVVMEDGDTATRFRRGPGERRNREPGPTYVVGPQGPTAWNLPPTESARSLHDVRSVSLKMPLTRSNTGGRYWVRTSDLFGVNEARYHCANRP